MRGAGTGQELSRAAKLAETTLSLQERAGQGPALLPAATEPPCPPVTPMHCGDLQVGYMFLGEVALGREYHITVDDPSLKSPPPGFDSVIARGQTEPDPTQDIKLELDGQQVVVPQGRPVPCPSFRRSHFSQSEYLIYKESQCRLRYLLEIHF